VRHPEVAKEKGKEEMEAHRMARTAKATKSRNVHLKGERRFSSVLLRSVNHASFNGQRATVAAAA
jgi:hypothetical protein